MPCCGPSDSEASMLSQKDRAVCWPTYLSRYEAIGLLFSGKHPYFATYPLL